MLTGFTKEELAQMAKEFNEKTENKIQELFEMAADYQIKTYDEMKKELESLQFQYEDEMSDYDDNAWLDDKTGFIIEMMEKQEDSESLQVYARDWLDALECIQQVTRPHWETRMETSAMSMVVLYLMTVSIMYLKSSKAASSRKTKRSPVSLKGV